MNYQELLALSVEDLTAKFVEVTGAAPEDGINKQKMASVVAKALAADTDKGSDESNTGNDDTKDEPGPGSDIEGKEENMKGTPGEGEQLNKKDNTPPVIQITPKVDPLAKVSDTKKIHLVKKANGKVIDEMQVPAAVWNNAPSGQKTGWEIKAPDELKSSDNESN